MDGKKMSKGYVVGYVGRQQVIYSGVTLSENAMPMSLKQAKQALKELSMSYGRSNRAIYKLVPIYKESAVDSRR